MGAFVTPDVLIVGAGHNGLTCAFYLARAGLRVRMLERRHIVGGAAVTEEFHPGFRNSTASYTVSLLQPKVIADMGLKERGLVILDRPFSNFLPQPDGRSLLVGGGLEKTQAEFARFSEADARALPAYYAMLDRVADVLRELALQIPPNAGGGAAKLLGERTETIADQTWHVLEYSSDVGGTTLDYQNFYLVNPGVGGIQMVFFSTEPDLTKAAVRAGMILGSVKFTQ